jgi:hypothetical protein
MSDERRGIPTDEIQFDGWFLGDPNGRLFWWRDHLYRGLTAWRADFYEGLFARGAIDTLVERGFLVKTRLTDLRLDGYALVVQHDVLSFVAYPFAWCDAMFKDAASFVLDLELELAREGMTTQDANPFNVVFDGCRPRFVDFASIVPLVDGREWLGRNQFMQHFVWPLQMMAAGHGRIARALLRDPHLRLTPDEQALAQRLGNRISAAARAASLYERVRSRLRPAGNETYDHVTVVEALRASVERIDMPRTPIDAPKAALADRHPSSAWSVRQRSIHRALAAARPASVLCAEATEPWPAVCAAAAGARVVVLDTNAAAVGGLYAVARSEKLDILPLIMDIANPSPAMGLCGRALRPAASRLRCDMVLALDVMLDLIFGLDLNFEQAIATLGQFAARWLVVDFRAWEDSRVRRRNPERKVFFPPRYFAWYTEDNLRAALSRQGFVVVETMDGDSGSNRLLFCERRELNG